MSLPLNLKAVEDYVRQIHKGRLRDGQVDEGMWREYYGKLKEGVAAGSKSGMLLSYGPDWEFNRQVHSNLASFSAFKNHSNTQELITQLINSDGTLKSYSKWRRDIAPTLTTYNDDWLQAEYQTALASSRMAEKWRNFQRRKATYPYLRYVTQNDGRVRDEHRPLHGVTRLVDDPFWNTYFPPNGWRCRCDVVQTSGPPTHLPDTDQVTVPETFKHNTGKDPDFYPNHPYKEHVSDSDRVFIENQAEIFHGRQLRQEARAWLADQGSIEIKLPGLATPAGLTMSKLKKLLGQPHSNSVLRNALIPVLSDMVRDGEVKLLRRALSTPGKHHEVAMWYYYVVGDMKDRIFLNVALYKNDFGARIYTITDTLK